MPVVPLSMYTCQQSYACAHRGLEKMALCSASGRLLPLRADAHHPVSSPNEVRAAISIMILPLGWASSMPRRRRVLLLSSRLRPASHSDKSHQPLLMQRPSADIIQGPGATTQLPGPAHRSGRQSMLVRQ